jgi:HSP20 family molecular chaperone IbpA
MTLLDIFDYPSPFWVTNHTGSRYYKLWEEDDHVNLEIDLPGVDKKDIELRYLPENKMFHIFVKEKIDTHIRSPQPINADITTSKLELGILKIRAPILNSSKQIQIE